MSKTKFKEIPSLSKVDTDRFWSHVDRSGSDRGCWNWTGSANSKGYGRFFVDGRHRGANRLSWLLAGRGLQSNLQICHTCDNKRCVNPDHLIMADAETNNRDAKLKRNLVGKRKQIKKPYGSFPLFPHLTGRWTKKIRGKFHYFGSTIDDPKGEKALEQLNREWPFLSNGRTPPPADTGDGCTLRMLCNSFLTSKKNKLDAGELSERSFADYHRICDMLIQHFGRDCRVDDLRQDDFEGFRKGLANRLGVVTLRNTINRCRVVFKYSHDQRLIDQPVNYGQSFNRPSAKVLRKARNEAGPRMFEVGELHQILDAADPVARAMVLLGCNAGFGNTDIASLPQAAVDLETGWIDFPRPKTEVNRRIPLWRETVEALREAIAIRPQPVDPADADLCFLTSRGRRWVRVQPTKSNSDKFVAIDALSQRFAKLLKKLDINGRKGLNFYTLRHVFESIGGESKDQVAVNSIMGHVDSSMAGVYRERISDERLQAVVDVVRQWLFDSE